MSPSPHLTAEDLPRAYRTRTSASIRAEIRAWRATETPALAGEKAAHLEAASDVLRERGERLP